MGSLENGSNKRFVRTEHEVEAFMKALVKRTVAFIEEEIKIVILEAKLPAYYHENPMLHSLTSIITIEDSARMTIVFSFEDMLIREIFRGYTKDIKIAEAETQNFIEETAGDMINTVLGNVLRQFEQPGVAFAISVPFIVNEAKNFITYRSSKIFSAEIQTEYGEMSIHCFMPDELV
jgi:CheY-specific phosphatase CheX